MIGYCVRKMNSGSAYETYFITQYSQFLFIKIGHWEKLFPGINPFDNYKPSLNELTSPTERKLFNYIYC